MPLERFYRLSAEKQKLIRHAALKEFARAPIDKVSINKIIKDADISRGSFYTYFEDKWDVLSYIFEKGKKDMRRFCAENLEKNQGNIWEMLVDFLSQTIWFCSQNDTYAFIKNVMMHSNSEEVFGGFAGRAKSRDGTCDELELWLYEKTDKSSFKTQSFDDFHRFLMVAMSSMALAMRDFYEGEAEETVKAEFAKKLELLRYGVCSANR